jgi:hypothetical protein
LRAPPLSLMPHEGITHLQRASTARRPGEALPRTGRERYRTLRREVRMTDIETPVLDMLVQMSANTLERSRLDPEAFTLLRIASPRSGRRPSRTPRTAARPTSSAVSRRRCRGHWWRSPLSWAPRASPRPPWRSRPLSVFRSRSKVWRASAGPRPGRTSADLAPPGLSRRACRSRGCRRVSRSVRRRGSEAEGERRRNLRRSRARLFRPRRLRRTRRVASSRVLERDDAPTRAWLQGGWQVATGGRVPVRRRVTRLV